MFKFGTPAVDSALVSRFGVSRQGQPLSYNRAPAPDIAPWIGRLYATSVEAPEGHRVDCGLFYDVTVARFQLRGQWEALTADGPRTSGRAALIFGPQTHLMPVAVTGSFVSIGFSLRPGTGHALLNQKTEDLLDRFVDCAELGLPGEAALAAIDRAKDAEECFQILEAFIRNIAQQMGNVQPDPVTTAFENASLVDPNFAVGDFARGLGISQRQLERIVSRDFGMSPKQVLRRARALDMAAQLRGVADEAEAEDILLRFYDQSHLIREFTGLFGMSPSQFVAKPQPIFTLALESRQARRLEVIERLEPGAKKPWELERHIPTPWKQTGSA